MNHTQIGDITEYRFAIYCMERNIPISKPMNNNLPYDFIIDIHGKLLKIQVKTGYDNKSMNSFMFNTKTTSKNFSEIVEKDYQDKIDGFITCYKDIPNKFYYIPVGKAAKGSMVIYFGDAPKINQNWGQDYDFDNLLS